MKFKIGDRIRVYGFDADDAGRAFNRNIENIESDGLIRTDADECVHPKQCRRLGKKPRRRVTLHFKSGIPWTYNIDDFKFGEIVEFIEVKRK